MTFRCWPEPAVRYRATTRRTKRQPAHWALSTTASASNAEKRARPGSPADSEARSANSRAAPSTWRDQHDVRSRDPKALEPRAVRGLHRRPFGRARQVQRHRSRRRKGVGEAHAQRPGRRCRSVEQWRIPFNDVAGLVQFTPASASNDGGIALRVPYYFVPRALSNVSTSIGKSSGTNPSITPFKRGPVCVRCRET